MNKDNHQSKKHNISTPQPLQAADLRQPSPQQETTENEFAGLTLEQKIRRVEQVLAHAQLLDDLGSRHSEPCVVSDEQRLEGRKEMALRLLFFLHVADRDNYYWTGSQIDLAEMAYHAWVHGSVRNKAGHPLPLKAIARRLFAKLHMPMPCNLYATVARARKRKGIVRDTLLNRYCYLRFTKGVTDPIGREVLKLSL